RALHSFPTRRSSDLAPQRIDQVAIAASCDEPPLGPVLLQVAPRDDQETRIELPPARRLTVRARDEDGRAVAAFTVVAAAKPPARSEEHTSELQSRRD